MMNRIAVIGGGAAGFFAAINCAIINKNSAVTIFEKSNKLLAKVRVSGGGRCNVTHACFDPSRLVDFYPRGKRELRGPFSRFNAQHTVEWFESRGVQLKTEDDGRMFPVTDDSETIIQCLLKAAQESNVMIKLQHAVIKLEKKKDSTFALTFQDGEQYICDKVIITTGGSPNIKSYEWLIALSHTIVSPVPSLFTFNIPASPLKGLEGIAVPDATINIPDAKLNEKGPVLITHWGISGPAVIRLSALAARWLHKVDYFSTIYINWLSGYNEILLKDFFLLMKQQIGTKKVKATSPLGLPQRLWERICDMSGIDDKLNYADLSNKMVNAFSSLLLSMPLKLRGKTTYKEEFVTCGGVNLKEVDLKTMESRLVPGLFFAGEVLDIDGITGGFNFQSAWTTGFLAGVNTVK